MGTYIADLDELDEWEDSIVEENIINGMLSRELDELIEAIESGTLDELLERKSKLARN